MRKLLKLRNQKGVSQQQVADAIGVSRGQYGHYETGHSVPSADIIIKLAQYFQTTPNDILDIQERVTDQSYLYIMGRDVRHTKKVLNAEQEEKIKKLIEVALPELIEKSDKT